MLPVLLTRAALAAPHTLPAPPCAPLPDPLISTVFNLRGHVYRLVGHCGAVPILRTTTTDSTFRDRDAFGGSVILVTETSADPTAAEGEWPAPPGNLYLSVVVPGPLASARKRLSDALETWRRQHAPEVVWTEAWDGFYGAHRGPDGRFVSGLVLDQRPEGVALGLDLHLGATPSAYAALGKEAEHVTLETLTGRSLPARQALWAVLDLLVASAPTPPADLTPDAMPPTTH